MLQSMGLQKVRQDWVTELNLSYYLRKTPSYYFYPKWWLKEDDCLIAKLCQTLHDPMDCSLPGSSVHGFLGKNYWSG